MKLLLNILAIIFMLGWVLGVFVFSSGFFIHVLLVLAVFSFIINFLAEPT